jgi:hypothetical protein
MKIKKLLSVLLSVVIVGISNCAVFANTTATTAEDTTEITTTFIYGDADCDYILTSADAAAVLQKVLVSSYKMRIESLTEDYMFYADVSGDGYLAADDAAQILQKVLNNRYKFGVEE